MLLTGKCKKDFNNWRFEIKKYRRNYVSEYNNLVVNNLIKQWFETIGFIIDTQPFLNKLGEEYETYNKIIFFPNLIIVNDLLNDNDVDLFEDEDYFNNSEKCIECVIKKANEIYNDRFK